MQVADAVLALPVRWQPLRLDLRPEAGLTRWPRQGDRGQVGLTSRPDPPTQLVILRSPPAQAPDPKRYHEPGR